MLDMHCHFLPGVDDGATSMVDTIKLFQASIDNGISRIVLTPHIHPGRWENKVENLQPIFNKVKETLMHRHMPVEIALGAEVRISDEIFDLMYEGELPFIGEYNGYRVMLLEFPHGNILPGSDHLVRQLIDENVLPMIAHPERNKLIMNHPEKLKPFLDLGCLTQLTAASLTGGFGRKAKTTARQLLKGGMVSVIATDAHNLKHRPPVLQEGAKEATKLIGESAAWDLVSEMPRRLTDAMFDGYSLN